MCSTPNNYLKKKNLKKNDYLLDCLRGPLFLILNFLQNFSYPIKTKVHLKRTPWLSLFSQMLVPGTNLVSTGPQHYLFHGIHNLYSIQVSIEILTPVNLDFRRQNCVLIHFLYKQSLLHNTFLVTIHCGKVKPFCVSTHLKTH